MTYEYVPSEDDPLLKTGEEKQYIDGKRVNSNYEYTYNSPIMKSKFDSGVIEIYFDDKVRTMDFINIKDNIK